MLLKKKIMSEDSRIHIAPQTSLYLKARPQLPRKMEFEEFYLQLQGQLTTLLLSPSFSPFEEQELLQSLFHLPLLHNQHMLLCIMDCKKQVHCLRGWQANKELV